MRGTPEIADRLLGALPYLLPFLNAFVYARFLYVSQPMVRAALQPIMPVRAWIPRAALFRVGYCS